MRRLPICPAPTQDTILNLANRQHAIDSAHYGPANPRLENAAFWASLASRWGATPAEARTMLCGNCAAFDITPEMPDCIKTGLMQGNGLDADEVIVRAELGYCRMLNFKCAASRTCSAWIVGGPIR